MPELDTLAAGGKLPILLYSAPRTDLFDVYDRLRSGVVVVSDLNTDTFARLETRFHKGQYIVLAMSRDVPSCGGCAAHAPVLRWPVGGGHGVFSVDRPAHKVICGPGAGRVLSISRLPPMLTDTAPTTAAPPDDAA